MKYLFANWKMYLDAEQSASLAREMAEKNIVSTEEQSIAVFPSALAMLDVKRILGNRCDIGAQNCSYSPGGAYTGAISAPMYRAAGCAYVLLGHSERRHLFGETDSSIAKKMVAALDADLVPVLCIGETKEEKEEGKREYRLKKQLFSAFEHLELRDRRVIVAYEPVWAIGTGDACLPLDADDVHTFIRAELATYSNMAIPILYGGSVTDKNIASYLALDTVDGVLIGSASTTIGSFVSLISETNKGM